MGQRRQAIDESRVQIARLVGCGDSELLFTGGGTEAINTAIRGILLALRAESRLSPAPWSIPPPVSYALD